MPVFLLVRHGENDYVKKGRLAGRLPGVHLNEHGIQQAHRVAEALKAIAQQRPVAAIYSSPMERTMETAQPIAEALGCEVIPRQGLLEVDVGDWQDRKLKGLSRLKVWRAVQFTPSAIRFPGGETFVEAQWRIVRELAELAEKHDPKDTLVLVTHSDPIKLAIAYFIGVPLDMFQRLAVSPASISVLYLGEGGARLLALNYDLSFVLPKP